MTKILLVLTATLFSLCACATKPGPLGEQTLDVTDFDFSTPITALLPERFEHPDFKGGWYLIPETHFDDTNMMHRDTVRSWDADEILWIEYRYSSSNSSDEYIRFGDQLFNAANFITDLDGRIVLVCGHAHSISEADSEALIEGISKRYGEPEITGKSFCRDDYDLYTWVLDDRTIKYAPISTDESNVMKLEVEHNEAGELTDIREGERQTLLQGYIYVIDGSWAEKICSAGRASGDFVYL